MWGILKEDGVAPLILLTMAALIPGMFVNGINTLAPNIQHSFHLSDSGLGAVAFVGVGVPAQDPQRGLDLGFAHNGMFPCFLGGRVWRLLRSIRRDLMT